MSNKRARRQAVEELLEASEKAPAFGLNARALILQAAIQAGEIHSASGGGREVSQETEKSSQLGQLLKNCPPYFHSLSKEERPYISFNAAHRWKVPRNSRQAVLERLVNQQIGLKLYNSDKPQEIEGIAFLSEVDKKSAIKHAVDMESDIFEKGKSSKAVYLSYAAQMYSGCCQATSKVKSCEAESQGRIPDPKHNRHKTKRQRHQYSNCESNCLVEAEIDWEQADMRPAAPIELEHDRRLGESASQNEPPLKQSVEADIENNMHLSASGSSERRSLEVPSPHVHLKDHFHSRHDERSSLQSSRMNHSEAQHSVVGSPEVVSTLMSFLKSLLDPLFTAEVICREHYKTALKKTLCKVMQSHAQDQNANFIIREGPKIQKLLMQHLDQLSLEGQGK